MGSSGLMGVSWRDIETLEARDPVDLDVVTFFKLPDGQTQRTLADSHPELFDHATTKSLYHVDAYFVPLDDNRAEHLVERSAYWYSLWSHRRNGQWKGYLQIDLSSTDDAAAQAEIREFSNQGSQQ